MILLFLLFVFTTCLFMSIFISIVKIVFNWIIIPSFSVSWQTPVQKYPISLLQHVVNRQAEDGRRDVIFLNRFGGCAIWMCGPNATSFINSLIWQSLPFIPFTVARPTMRPISLQQKRRQQLIYVGFCPRKYAERHGRSSRKSKHLIKIFSSRRSLY